MQQHFRLLISEFSPTCFGRPIRPSSGALFDYIYSFWYNAQTLLPTGAVAPVGSSVGTLYEKLYMQSKSAPEDGRIGRPKHIGLN